MRKVLLFIYLLLICPLSFTRGTILEANPKFEKWQKSSYFRGYNILYESPHTFQDFKDFKNYGGNLFHIGTFGWLAEDPPYDVKQQNIDGTDLLVNFCRQTGVYYTIAVRSGPGAYDTYLESQGITGESRIWESGNIIEQNLYANMLKNIVQRYSNDSLFVGIVLVVEPRPKVKVIPANKSETYKFFLENIYNIHMDAVYQGFIGYIRTVDPEIPVIVENFGYSTPELFPAYKLNDPYIVYSAHNYQPKEYTSAELTYSVTYPGTYWNLTFLAQKFYDKDFISNTIFGRVREFAVETGKPVLLGEFGMLNPQHGAHQYIGDVLDICIDNGWHFALWDWRRGSGVHWNIENFHNDISHPFAVIPPWFSVLKRLHAPPVPVQTYPINGELNVPVPFEFSWKEMTPYTRFDAEVFFESVLIDSVYDISAASFSSNVEYKWGRTYQWRLRSRNPGGSISAWTKLHSFTIIEEGARPPVYSNLSENKLNQNYPNPFNPSTNILYSIKSNSFVKLVIYDLVGREVKTLVNWHQPEGNYSVTFDASSLPSGIYIYKLDVSAGTSRNYSEVKKMILVK